MGPERVRRSAADRAVAIAVARRRERDEWRQKVKSNPEWRAIWLQSCVERCQSLAVRAAAVNETEQFGPAFEAFVDAEGWLWFHDSDSRRDEAGLPDYVLVHPQWGRIVFAELKSARGKLRPSQVVWLRGLVTAGAEAYVFRPGDASVYLDVLGCQTRPSREWVAARLEGEWPKEPRVRPTAEREDASD